jgi:integrase
VEYRRTEGQHGLIYQIADGLYVDQTEYGSWRMVLNRDGKRKKQSFGKGEEAFQQAIKAAELLASRMGFAVERQTDKTFGIVAKEWFELNSGRWKPGTIERYECIVRDFLRPLEKVPLEQVDKVHVKRLLAELLKIRAPKTVEVVHAVISGIFAEAIELGYTERNPAHGLLKRLLPAKRKRVLSLPDPFTRQDLEHFLEAAWQKLPEPYPLIMETMAMTGMRLGEVLMISRENLDSRNRQYFVKEATRAGVVGTPKTGERLIDLDEETVLKLEVHLKKMRQVALRDGRLSGHYLFPGITHRMIQRAMETACKAARLRRRNPHDLRHTYATLLLMDHISPAYVQKQLGHSSISITVDLYGHWIPGEGKKDLDKALRGPEAVPGRALRVVRRLATGTGEDSSPASPVTKSGEKESLGDLPGKNRGRTRAEGPLKKA